LDFGLRIYESDAALKIQNPKSKSKISYWLPPLLWMAAMFSFSTDAFSAEQTGSRLLWFLQLVYPAITQHQYEWVHFLTRKAAHFTEYAILAGLWWRAFRAGALVKWEWRWAWWAFVIVAVWALLDEWHQSFTLSRTASPYDSLLDISGGLTALVAIWVVQMKQAN
jgi:VanZ family protein